MPSQSLQPRRANLSGIPSFWRSLIPMVIADDDRRYTAVNAAACLLLRLPEQEVLGMTVDDLTPPENRAAVGALWEAFIRDGTQQGTFALLMPDGQRVEVEYSATAEVAPGQHLSILIFPAGQSRPAGADESRSVLTDREREVLALIAMGQSGADIAAELCVSASTVETHVRHCLEKLGARNRAHAIALGLRRGEISLGL